MMLSLVLAVVFCGRDMDCPKATAPEEQNLSGSDIAQVRTATFGDCQKACCANLGCFSWNWDSNLSTHRPSACPAGGCCWLKGPHAVSGSNCGNVGHPGCASWSGKSGRTPPGPPPCPPHEQCFHNHGTRPGVPKSFDCEVRKHALAFGKATLPNHGEFQSAYDALQLQACGVPRPAAPDTYVAPTFPTPTQGHVLWVDGGTGGGGSGNATNPFLDLDAAVAAAGALAGPVTIVLKAGRYHTPGIVLSKQHSGLTIQNDDGAEVTVSGAVPFKTPRAKWTVHNSTTNTWRFDATDMALPAESFGMRVGERRAIRAKYPNGDPETAAAFCIIPLGSIASPGVYLPGSGVSEDYPEYFPREHVPVNKTVEFWAHPSDWPGTFWHNDTANMHPQSIGGYGPFFYAQGGTCSGRVPDHGYWCSSHNPRGSAGCARVAGSDGGEGCAQHNIDPPGGFLYGQALPQAEHYKNPKGAVVHARGGSMPYFSYMCLVDAVTDGKVLFDPSVGCDQGGPTPVTPGKAWDWFIENVKEECDSPGEYFYDAEEEALYYTFNATETPTGDEDFALVTTKLLFNITGTMADPVKGVTIRGLTLRDAALTFLGTTEADRHWLPSEGDWALQRSGAVHMEGAATSTLFYLSHSHLFLTSMPSPHAPCGMPY